MLSPETVLLFQHARDLKADLTLFDLLLVTAACRECEPVLVVDFEELDALASQISEQPSNLLTRNGCNLREILKVDPRRLLSAMKMATVMREWTRTGNVEHVADENDCYAFEVSRLRDSISRALLAFHHVVVESRKMISRRSMMRLLLPNEFEHLHKWLLTVWMNWLSRLRSCTVSEAKWRSGSLHVGLPTLKN